MVWVHVIHRVEHFAKWKSAFDSFAEKRRTAGSRRFRIFKIDEDPTNVLVMEAFASLDQARAFAQSAELKAAMGSAGVRGAPQIKFVEDVAEGTT